MQIKQRNNKSAQTTLGYVIFIIILIAAFSALTAKLRQKTQASYKESADAFGEGRQFESFSPSGSVAPLVFPVLPGGGPVVVVPPIFPPIVDCDHNSLSFLANKAFKQQQKATALTEEGSDARIAAARAQVVAVKAQIVALNAREEATQARLAATAARQVAYNSRVECNSCNAGNQGCTNCTNCTPTCVEAARLTAIASAKEGIAAEKEGIAAEKEATAQAKQAEADRLDGIAKGKENAAEQAGAEAEAAADALQEANEACSGGEVTE